jgi:hypothetical protein
MSLEIDSSVIAVCQANGSLLHIGSIVMTNSYDRDIKVVAFSTEWEGVNGTMCEALCISTFGKRRFQFTIRHVTGVMRSIPKKLEDAGDEETWKTATELYEEL